MEQPLVLVLAGFPEELTVHPGQVDSVRKSLVALLCQTVHTGGMAHERWEVIEVRNEDGRWRRVGPHRAGSAWCDSEEFPDSGRSWEPFSSTETSVLYRKYVPYLPHDEAK